jgi:hypothetical protein
MNTPKQLRRTLLGLGIRDTIPTYGYKPSLEGISKGTIADG